MIDKAEIVIYKESDSPDFQIEVWVEDETVWLNRQQMAELFSRDIKTIGKHINNALREELKSIPVIAKFATTASDGKTYQVEHYSLDMILSVGYRVKSQRGILIIDNKDVYHIGASLKDLGKRPVVSKVEPWFAFSKINLNANELISKLAD